MWDALAVLESLLVDATASPWMPLLLLAVCVLDGFFPPVPSEAVLLAAATVTWTVQPELIVVIVAVATLGAWAGDNLAYLIGRRLGRTPFAWMRRGRTARALERVEAELHRRPESIVVTARFVPVARVLVSMAAGATRLPYRRYAPLSLAGAAAWAFVSVALAVLIGTLVASQPLLAATIAVVIGLAGGVLVDRVIAWRRRQTERSAAHDG